MTKQEAMNLSTGELIQKFDLFQISHFTGRKVVYEDKLGARRIPYGLSNATAMEVLSPRKQEVLDYLKAERDAREKAMNERKAKIDSIPGLKEIQNAQADLAMWYKEFNRSFDERYGAGVGGMGVRAKPKYDIAAMKRQYPVAAAYLKAEAESEKANYELAAIGKQALEEIINDPEHYADALARMDAKHKEFVNEHIWD